MRSILLAIVCALLTCCGEARQPAAGDKATANQNAVEAASGLQAAQAMLGASMTPVLADVLNGSAAFARATMGKDQAPAAAWTPARIIGDPHAFLQAGMSAERHANGSWNLWALGVAAMTVMPFLLYAAKFIPVVGPYVESIGGVLWKTYAARATKDQEEQRDIVYGHAATLLNTALAVMPPDTAATFEAKVPKIVMQAILGAPTPPGT